MPAGARVVSSRSGESLEYSGAISPGGGATMISCGSGAILECNSASRSGGGAAGADSGFDRLRLLVDRWIGHPLGTARITSNRVDQRLMLLCLT
jgi:hypothetical protein